MGGAETTGIQVGRTLLDAHQKYLGVTAGISGRIRVKRVRNKDSRIITIGTRETGRGRGGRAGTNQVGAGGGAGPDGLSGRRFSRGGDLADGISNP